MMTNRGQIVSNYYSQPWWMILFCEPSMAPGRQHACMQVSQSEKQPQRPVLHLSDMLAGDRSVSLRARVGEKW
jgi:hypothetical protein